MVRTRKVSSLTDHRQEPLKLLVNRFPAFRNPKLVEASDQLQRREFCPDLIDVHPRIHVHGEKAVHPCRHEVWNQLFEIAVRIHEHVFHSCRLHLRDQLPVIISHKLLKKFR